MAEIPKKNRHSEVIYQVYPATFSDSGSGKLVDHAGEHPLTVGMGDLNGITDRLGYIQSLGVDSIWISPFFLSPAGKNGDGGYAVTNYREIDPKYGTMADFDRLLAEAHQRGLKIYTDFVICHTSDESKWFEASRNPAHPEHETYKDYYVWHPGKMDVNGQRQPPNNWLSCFKNERGMNDSAWQWDDTRQAYYLRHFSQYQPALNLNRKEVRERQIDEMRFWLDKGVDGMRIDALPFANHDPEFRDNDWRFWVKAAVVRRRNEAFGWGEDNSKPWEEYVTAEFAKIMEDSNQRHFLETIFRERGGPRWDWQYFDRSICQDSTVEFAREIRAAFDEYLEKDGNKRFALGETIAGREGGGNSIEVAASYVGPGGLDTGYTDLLFSVWNRYPNAPEIKSIIDRLSAHSPDGGFTVNKSNHDFPLAYTRMAGESNPVFLDAIHKQMNYISMHMMPGTFCMYQGEELGLPSARIPQDIPYDQLHDIDANSRDIARTPFPHDSREKNMGFSDHDKLYLPIPASHRMKAVNLQDRDPNSILNDTRDLIAERKANPALSEGVVTWTKIPPGSPSVLAVLRETEGQTVLLTTNLSLQRTRFRPAEVLDEVTMQKLGITDPNMEIEMGPAGCLTFGTGHELDRMEKEKPEQREDKKVRVFSSSVLFADYFTETGQIPQSLAQIGDYGLHKGTLTREQHEHIMREAKHTPEEATFGGHVALLLWMLQKALPDQVETTLMTMVPDDPHGHVAKKMMTDGGVKIVQDTWPADLPPEGAVSHVIEYPDKKFQVRSNVGNVTEAMARARGKEEIQDLLTRNIVNTDVVILPGVLEQFFGHYHKNQILHDRWEHDKKLVMTLPIHAEFGEQDNTHFQQLIASADVVTASAVQFSRLYNMKPLGGVVDAEFVEKNIAPRVQAAFKAGVLAKEGKHADPDQPQVAFITCGKEGAVLVTANGVKRVDPMLVEDPGSFVGNGTAATFGFIMGYIKGLPHEKSADLGMAMAAEKIRQKSHHAHITDPEEALWRALLRPELRDVASRFKNGVHAQGSYME